jgi:hypothetical protein
LKRNVRKLKKQAVGILWGTHIYIIFLNGISPNENCDISFVTGYELGSGF